MQMLMRYQKLENELKIKAMEKLQDYSSMSAVVSDWSVEKLTSEIEKYQEEDRIYNLKLSSIENYIYVLRANIAYFIKRKRELYMEKLEKEFILKPEHKKILQLIEINFNGEDGRIRAEGLGYLYKDYLLDVFGKDKYKLSEQELSEYAVKFDKLMDEMPFAIKELSKL
jgi:hypothetical protein